MKVFEGQTVIVTGGSSGIGRATSMEFARRGAHVVVSDINEEGGRVTQEQISKAGGESIFVKTDIRYEVEVDQLFEKCIQKYGQMNHLVNNAGIGEGLYFFEDITTDHYLKTIAVNQTGVFFCMRAALKIMKQQGGGNIINTASAAGIRSAPRMGAYAASKHAVVGMTKTAAAEYGKYGIRINAICPTVIETPMGESYLSDNQQLKDVMIRSVPMRRFGKAEEVAKTICWLCSEDASYLNGVALPIDGGSNA